MPAIIDTSNELFGKAYIWFLSETEDFLMDQLSLNPVHLQNLTNWTAVRRKEWLGGRWLIQHYLGYTPAEVMVDNHGKPFVEKEGLYISLSHSGAYIAIAFNQKPIGVDIQLYKPKISKISHKFCTPKEHRLLAPYFTKYEQEHLIWSVKESIYKSYGKKNLDFKENISFTSVSVNTPYTVLNGTVTKSGKTLSYKIQARHILDTIFTVAVQLG